MLQRNNLYQALDTQDSLLVYICFLWDLLIIRKIQNIIKRIL